MKITFWGAAREVTGSCYLLEANAQNLLVDCGMQQGRDAKDEQRLPFQAGSIRSAVLTHAHIDHSGRLPLLVKDGFAGSIYATKATCDLLAIMLRDSAHIQAMDAQWENGKSKRAGRPEAVPLYTLADAEQTLEHLVPCKYGQEYELFEGARVRFTDAGHILGSSSVELFLREGPDSRKIVFSGDVGNTGQPLIRDPQCVEQADAVVMESTYGDREHPGERDYPVLLAGIIDRTLARGGNVVIPAFAVGRTQELLFFLREIKERGLVRSVPGFPVYVDSPLASQATRIYSGVLRDYADEQTSALLAEGINPLSFGNLRILESNDDSRALNSDPAPKVIISASGMCEAGRIRHHLKHNLWRTECAVVFVGYQAQGTLGRILLDGVRKVKLFGEEIAVAASIHDLAAGLSAHADKPGLMRWLSCFGTKPNKVYVTHGEASVCESFAQNLLASGFAAEIPRYGSRYDLRTGERVSPGTEREPGIYDIGKARAVPAGYGRLLAASEWLADVVRRTEGASNRDIEKFRRDVAAVAAKWDPDRKKSRRR